MNETASTPGARLRAAREQRGLSTQKAADELHLESWVIDALEAGDYGRIGPAVYGKGYLKRYSTMLGLPIEEMLADFGSTAQPAAAAGAPSGGSREAPPVRTVSTTQMALVTAVMLLAVALAWWKPWEQHPGTPSVNTSEGSAATPRAADIPAEPPQLAKEAKLPAATPPAASKASPTRASTSTAPVTAMVARPQGGAPVPSAKTPGAPVPAAPPLAMVAKPQSSDTGAGGGAIADPLQLPGAGKARLRLSFTADSFVDVRDALGNRAFAGTGSANTVKSISGQAPMHVYLRSASGVQLEINGRAVAIGPQYFAGDVARFEAGADGVLRRESRRDATAANTRPPG